MIMYEETNNLVSGAFLKIFSIIIALAVCVLKYLTGR